MEKSVAQNKIVKSIFSVSAVVFLGKILGFIKQAVTAAYFGATIETDVISLAESLIGNVDYLIVQTLMAAFIPLYIDIRKRKGDSVNKFVSDTLIFFFFLPAVIAIFVELSAPLIARIIAPSYNSDLNRVLASYIRLFAPLMIVIVLYAVFNALLKSNNHFVPGECASIIQSVTTIGLILLIGKTVGPDTIAISFIAYSLITFVFLGILSKKYWHLEKSNPLTDPDIKALLKMMLPLLFGYAMIFINQHVDLMIVSGLGEGVVTAMHYASTLSNLVTTFIVSTCSVVYTYIANAVSDGNDDQAASLVNVFNLVYFTALLPISILTIMNAQDIVDIVFGRGAFDQKAVQNTALALIGYAVMFVPYAFRELLNRFHYGYQDSKTPMINSTIGIMANIVLSIILSRFIGILGVTLATSISVIITAALNAVSARKKNKSISLSAYVKYIPLWILGGLSCVLVSKLGAAYFQSYSAVSRFLIIAVISMAAYLIITSPVIIKLYKNIKTEKYQ